MERESEVGKGGENGGGKKMTLVCCKEFLNLRVVMTSATIWSISNPWATFALMKVKQDGVGVGGRGVEGEDGWWGRGWDACHGLQRGPQTKKRQESVSAVTKQSLWVHISKHRFRSLKYYWSCPLKVRVSSTRFTSLVYLVFLTYTSYCCSYIISVKRQR